MVYILRNFEERYLRVGPDLRGTIIRLYSASEIPECVFADVNFMAGHFATIIRLMES